MSNSAPQLSGQRFGRYVLLELVGRGGMAEVYRAVAHGLEGFQRVFVIKRILKDKSANPEFVEMFVNEARISALLNHPNIVQIYDFGQIDGNYFLAMEHLRGKDLLSVLRQMRASNKHMSAEVAAYIAQQVALGLDYAHTLTHAGRNLKIVHRDVSPSNIMLLRAGGVKLLDFGIAKAAAEVRTENETQAGLVKGKLSYVSPEQIRGATNVDARSDVFALGVVLWEALTGRRLFFDKSDFQTMRNVVERPVPPPSTQRGDVPPALDFIVLRALERDPERRYPNAKAMAHELEAVLQEARFAPRAMTRMLDDLFGEVSSQVDLLPEELGEAPTPITSPPTPPDAMKIEVAQPDALMAAVAAQAPGFDDEPESYAGVSSVSRLPTRSKRRVSWMAAAGAAVLTLAGGAVLVGTSRRHNAGSAEESAISSRVAEAAASSGAASGTAAPVVVPLPDKVSVKIDSDPPGASIATEDGIRLGLTPTTLVVPRSKKPLSLVVTKAGFAPGRQSIALERDVSALLTLRAGADEAPPKRERARAPVRRRREPVSGDGRVREGLSVDPFAEDPRQRN